MQTKVLFLEDDRSVGQTTAAVLQWNGFDVKVASSPEEAEVIACNWQPDILLCDALLADGVTGFGAAANICEMLPNCRVLMFSAQFWSEEDMRRLGFGRTFPLLLKPIHPEQLVRALQNPPSGPIVL